MYFLLLAILVPIGYSSGDILPHRGLAGLMAPEIAASLPTSGIGGFGAYEGAWAITFELLGLPGQLARLSGVSHHLFTQAYGALLGIAALLLLITPWLRTTFATQKPPPERSVAGPRFWARAASLLALWSLFVFALWSPLTRPTASARPSNVEVADFTAEETAQRPKLAALPPGWILFDTNRSGTFGIYRMKPDGSRLEKIVDSPAEDMFPVRRPDRSMDRIQPRTLHPSHRSCRCVAEPY